MSTDVMSNRFNSMLILRVIIRTSGVLTAVVIASAILDVMTRGISITFPVLAWLITQYLFIRIVGGWLNKELLTPRSLARQTTSSIVAVSLLTISLNSQIITILPFLSLMLLALTPPFASIHLLKDCSDTRTLQKPRFRTSTILHSITFTLLAIGAPLTWTLFLREQCHPLFLWLFSLIFVMGVFSEGTALRTSGVSPKDDSFYSLILYLAGILCFTSLLLSVAFVIRLFSPF